MQSNVTVANAPLKQYECSCQLDVRGAYVRRNQSVKESMDIKGYDTPQ